MAVSDLDLRELEPRAATPGIFRWGLLWLLIVLSFVAVISIGLWSWGYNGYGGYGNWQHNRPDVTGPGPTPIPPGPVGGPRRP